ncbi:ABC transporter ATP-binding protein [Candidatus Micrarchaeota archaeon]|nr:ABC transporter ATP-binding protein [Candidatus Micrarchaeota archaeon]
MESVVSVSKISKSFSSGQEKIKALDSVNFNINKGEVFGLLGPNGAGKTTLIAILCGFLIPDSGTASIFNMSCTTQSEKIQKRMNFVSGFSGVMDFFTAEELLYFYCMLYNLDNTKKRVDTALKITDLQKHRKRIAADFSSGLSRRFLISKALLNDPEVLLLDEPTVGLDVDAASNMRNMINKMKKTGTTILLTTHNMREAEELCDRVALIKEGRIIACGTFAELRKKFFPLEVVEVHSDDPDKLEKQVLATKLVIKTQKLEDSIKFYLKSKTDVNKLLKAVISSGVGIRSITTIEPELEDLYTKVMRNV